MGYSETVFGVAADIVCSAESSSTANPQEVFEDLVIALSLDTGLPRKEARKRLAAKVAYDCNMPYWTPIRGELGSTIANTKPRRVR